MKKAKRTPEMVARIKARKEERKNAKGTYYKEVRNEAKPSNVGNNFKLVPKAKAMRLIAGIAYTRFSRFFNNGILKLVTEYVGK